MLKNILSQWHKYLLWALLSLLFWPWIFSLVTEVPANSKLVLCVDAPALQEEEMARALSGELPEGIRQLAVHRFEYYLFDQKELSRADVYLVPESSAAAYAWAYLPLAEAGLDPGGHAVWEQDGVALGIYLEGTAGGFLGPEERWLLCFGSGSVHREDGRALWLADQIIQLS